MNATTVLERAADALTTRGWTQYRLVSLDRRLCAIGALYQVTPLGQEYVLAAAIAALTQEVGGDVVQWNDAPGRIVEEVVTAMRNAKRWCEEGV